MAELVYTRVSTAEQSTARQTHLLAEAGLVDGAHGVRLFADPATSSKIPALHRDGFRELARYARPGDRLTVSELYRLCRDLQNELTREGLAAARANGAISGRRPQVATNGDLEQVRRQYREGASIAALARQHRVSRVAIRTALADLLPDRPEQPAPTDIDEPRPIRIEMPGKLAHHLTAHTADLGETERHALRDGRQIRRGQGYSLHVTAPPHIHQALLAAAEPLAHSTAAADRKAYRIYRDRLAQQPPA
ncbi:recombinase family protein [Nocardia cyriacigeorgica]|uniref:recombinase family protein n=1 Tax=Nocardia cyriacigeorgica TaxID=135487 RepID=UPI0013D7482D|nr:recombinase family protein [Nocardia cyriacigeorgica]NEW29240.1 recombinase family protein [Nocardia cyriacigeorgica]